VGGRWSLGDQSGTDRVWGLLGHLGIRYRTDYAHSKPPNGSGFPVACIRGARRCHRGHAATEIVARVDSTPETSAPSVQPLGVVNWSIGVAECHFPSKPALLEGHFPSEATSSRSVWETLRHLVPCNEVVDRVGLKVSAQVLDLNRPSPVLRPFPGKSVARHPDGLRLTALGHHRVGDVLALS